MLHHSPNRTVVLPSLKMRLNRFVYCWYNFIFILHFIKFTNCFVLMQKKKMYEKQKSNPDMDDNEQRDIEIEMRELRKNKTKMERNRRKEKKKEIRDKRANTKF